MDSNFLNSNFSFENLNFVSGNKYYSFSLKWLAHHFCKNGCQITTVCQLFSQVKIAFHKKRGSLCLQCKERHIFLEHPSFVGMQQMCFMHNSYFITRTTQKTYLLKGWELQLVIPVSSKTFVSGTGILFYCVCMLVKNMIISAGAIPLTFTQAPAVLPSLIVYHLRDPQGSIGHT